MPWYVYSILSAVLFAGMVLCTRYLGNKGHSAKQILLFLLGFAFLGFLGINVRTIGGVVSSEQFWPFALVMTITGAFIVIGNWVNFTATIRAPNPGFVGAINNSSVLLIILLSVFIFGSPLTLSKLAGALLAVGGMAVLLLEKKDSSTKLVERSSLRWDVLAGIGALTLTISALGVKKVCQMGYSSQEINLFNFGLNFLAFAFLCRKEIVGYFRDKIRLKIFLPVVILSAAFSFFANIFHVKGLAVAPNPGYNEAIKNAYILLVTLLSVPLVGASLNKQKLLGVVMVLAGVIILVI